MNPKIEELARQGEAIYAERLKDRLEKTHRNQFVAIEPISGDYFLGKTASQAAEAADNAFPGRLTHVIRIGHETAVEIGCHLWLE